MVVSVRVSRDDPKPGILEAPNYDPGGYLGVELFGLDRLLALVELLRILGLGDLGVGDVL